MAKGDGCATMADYVVAVADVWAALGVQIPSGPQLVDAIAHLMAFQHRTMAAPSAATGPRLPVTELIRSGTTYRPPGATPLPASIPSTRLAC